MGNTSTARAGRLTAPLHAADNTIDNMRNAGAGWYYDPDDQAIYRYWDGQAWTEHRSDTVLSVIPS
ncbi:MAG: DUF2510 domain-containing protein [Acidimicrobiales bacterium]